MQSTPYKCTCGGEIQYYNIGFDDGYQCMKCKHIYEHYELNKLDKEGETWLKRLHGLMNGKKVEV